MHANDPSSQVSGRWRQMGRLVLDALEGMGNRLRTFFITGVILLVPTVVTLFIIFQLFLFADGFLGASISRALGYRLPGLGLIVTFLLFVTAGAIGQNVLGKRLLQWVEYSLETLPVVRSLYVGVKQVSDVLFQQRPTEFQRVILVEFPRRGLWMVGFVTNEHVSGYATPHLAGGHQMLSVFIPTTPNPTSGFLILAERSEVLETRLGIEEAMKLVVSGGLAQVPPLSHQTATPDEFRIPH